MGKRWTFAMGLLVAVALVSGVATNAVAESTFSGTDTGASGVTTNSDAAFDSWAASVASYSMDDFSGLSSPNFTTDDGNDFDAVSGSGSISDSNYHSGGVVDGPDYLVLSRDGDNVGSFVWTLATPSNAFGVFGLDNDGGTITIGFTGGASSTYTLPAATGSDDSLFWGISGTSTNVSSVTISSTDQPGVSSWDNFVTGTTIPEPSTYAALISMGLMGLAIAWRRRRQK